MAGVKTYLTEYKDKLAAIEYAQSICDEEIVEYGIRIMEAECTE